MKYEVVIGMEVHVEIGSKSKVFCACDTGFDAPANTHTCQHDHQHTDSHPHPHTYR